MSDLNDMDEDDINLFRNTVGPVVPVKDDKVLPTHTKPPPVPMKTMEEDKLVLAELQDGMLDPAELETGDELIFKRDGIQNRVFTRLRKGEFSTEAQIDLHGMTVEVARETLKRFLAECRDRHRKCVKIIHGKGIGSKNGKPVIKNKVNVWLQRRDDVLAFCSARPVDGGTGAIYVLLKK